MRNVCVKVVVSGANLELQRRAYGKKYKWDDAITRTTAVRSFRRNFKLFMTESSWNIPDFAA